MQYRFASLACRASIVWQRFFLMFWDVELPLRYIDDSTVVVGLKAGFLEFPLKALDLFLKPLCAFGGWRCCILLEPAFRDTNAGYALPFVCLVPSGSRFSGAKLRTQLKTVVKLTPVFCAYRMVRESGKRR